ncbi:hypothetical protein ACFLT1_00395 [Bacteroidota bacterium]
MKFPGWLKPGSPKDVILNIKFDKKSNRRRLILSIFSILAITLCIVFEMSVPDIVFTIVNIVGATYLLITLSIVLVLNEKHIVRNNVILITMAILSIIFKGFHWSGSSTLLIGSVITIAIGYFFYSFKIYYSVQDNKYLRIVGVIASIVITITSIGTVFKYMHWPGAAIGIYVGLPVFIVVTFIVLITLPNSGYIKWSAEHRKIFTQRFMIIWIFLFLFAAFKFLLPEQVERNIFTIDVSESQPYNMIDYPIPDAEGLEKGQ